MKEIERFLNRVCRFLRVAPSLKTHIREELREHILESKEAHMREGLSEEEALKLAMEAFGSPDTVGEELSQIHNQNLFSFVLDRAMAWREQTMKTEWKWNFVAVAGMVMVIGIELLMCMVCVVYVLPVVLRSYQESRMALPAFLDQLISAIRFFHDWWFVPLCLFAGAWILFELKYKKPSKANIRSASLAVACVGMTLVLSAVTLATLIPAAWLVREPHLRQAIHLNSI